MNEGSSLVEEVSTDGEEERGGAESGGWAGAGRLALNLANSTLGAGVLGLALVARDAGLLAALALLLSCALLTDWTLHLLLRAHLLSKRPTYAKNKPLSFGVSKCCNYNRYEGIGELCFGRSGKWAVAVGIMLINFGAMIAYLVIIGDMVAPLFPVSPEHTTYIQYAVIAVGTAIAFPLCLVRGKLLAIVSAASVLLVVGFTIMV